MQAKGTKINSNPRLAQDSCSRPARVQASPSPGSTPCCAAAAGQSSSGGAGAGGGVCKGSGGSSSSSHPEAMHYSGCGMWSALTHALAHHGHGHSHGHDAPKQSPTHRAAGYSWLLHKLAPHLLDEHHAKQPSHKGGMEQTAACPQPASALDRSSSLSTSYVSATKTHGLGCLFRAGSCMLHTCAPMHTTWGAWACMKEVPWSAN